MVRKEKLRPASVKARKIDVYGRTEKYRKKEEQSSRGRQNEEGKGNRRMKRASDVLLS